MVAEVASASRASCCGDTHGVVALLLACSLPLPGALRVCQVTTFTGTMSVAPCWI